jgi:hypothetical protein
MPALSLQKSVWMSIRRRQADWNHGCAAIAGGVESVWWALVVKAPIGVLLTSPVQEKSEAAAGDLKNSHFNAEFRFHFCQTLSLAVPLASNTRRPPLLFMHLIALPRVFPAPLTRVCPCNLLLIAALYDSWCCCRHIPSLNCTGLPTDVHERER